VQSEPNWTPIGTFSRPFYSDTTIEYGKTYQYFVQSVERTGEKYAESEDSPIIEWKPVDQFPPAVPAGLTAVPGARTIELVWERNTDRDFASYRVYRDGQRIAEGLGSPAYSDKDVKTGTKYRYQISAVDTSGNESVLSAAVEAAIE
jgi:predicted phage tail protein